VKLTVIGCSPAWPNAGGAQSGYLDEGEGRRLLLDCGPGVLARLRRLDDGWPRVDAVAITHFHLDHWGDLVPWIFGASFGPGREVPKPELWLPPHGRERLIAYGGEMSFEEQIDGAFTVREYEDATLFEAAGFDVMPLRLDHYSEKTFGLRVSNHSSTLAYSGDTGPSPNLAELARNADLFLCEATLREPEPAERGHLSEDEAVSAFTASGARRLLVIHRPDELALDPSLERAQDGDVIEF
jgi:ribonuclease BN (tRNA processing enzyme)